MNTRTFILPVLFFVSMAISINCSKSTGSDNGTTGDIVYLDRNITADTRLTADKEYLLIGQTFVNAGATLTIDPGVTIKAVPYDNKGLPSALIIERNARLIADGTRDRPITFTSSLPNPRAGSWGGLIILGNAPVNTGSGESFVEGLAGRVFGGNNSDDDSGILRYLRVWFGGRKLGLDVDLSGIVLAGVGRGTVVEYCEVAYNHDDGFEMFGGTVDIRYCSSLFAGGRGFDAEMGYTGRGQFLFALMGEQPSEEGIRLANNHKNINALPRTHPNFFNVTLVGAGKNGLGDGVPLIDVSDGAGGNFGNMLMVEGKGFGVVVEGEASTQLLGKELFFSKNNIIYNCSAGQFKAEYGLTALDINPLLRSLSGREEGGEIDPRPSVTGPGKMDVDTIPVDDFFVKVDFKGAFDPDEPLWLKGWSWLDKNGRIP